jgi:hypothetical protein
MPCYQVNVISVELKAENEAMLTAALETLGHQYVFNSDGSVTVRTNGGNILIKDGRAQFSYANGQADVNALKREYAKEGVKAVAKKYGFNIKTQSESNKMELWKYTSN